MMIANVYCSSQCGLARCGFGIKSTFFGFQGKVRLLGELEVGTNDMVYALQFLISVMCGW